MRIQACRAILFPIFAVNKVSSALIAQHVKRAPAEQAVEIVGISTFMAWEIFTFLMCKI